MPVNAEVNPIRDYSTRLLASGAGDPDVSAEALAAHADREGIAGLLLQLPVFAQPHLADQRAALQAVARQAAMLEMGGFVETRQVLSLLADAGIEALVLKGAALAHWLYREPWHRPRSDLDVLVRDNATARKAVELLRAGGTAITGEDMGRGVRDG